MGVRAFCPICGHFSFAYDPQIKLYRCYNADHYFVDEKKEHGEGLSSNPFTIYDPSTDTTIDIRVGRKKSSVLEIATNS